MTKDDQDRHSDPLAPPGSQRELGRKAAQGGVIALVGQVGRVAIQLVSAAIMARLLSPEDFGLVAMALAATSFVALFSDLGLSTAVVQRKDLDQDTVSAIFMANLGMGTIVMLSAMALAPIAATLFEDWRVFWIISATALSFPIASAGAVHAALLRRKMEWLPMQIANLAAMLTANFCAIMLAWQTDAGYWALAANGWVMTLFTTIAMWRLSSWRPSKVRNWQGLRESLSFGVFLSGYGLLDYVSRQVDNIIVGAKFGAEDLGYYGRSYALFLLPITLLVWPLTGVAISTMSRLSEHKSRLQEAYHRMVLPIVTVCSLIGGLGFFAAHPIITTYYGEQWVPSVNAFQYFCLAWLVQPFIATQQWVYSSIGKTKIMLKIGVAMALIYLIGFALASQYSINAMALSYFISTVAIVSFVVISLCKHMETPLASYASIQLSPPICAALAIGCVFYVFPQAASRDGFDAILTAAIFTLFFVAFLSLAIVSLKGLRQCYARSFELIARGVLPNLQQK